MSRLWLVLALLLTGCAARPAWDQPLTAAAAQIGAAGDNLCVIGRDGVAYGVSARDGKQSWTYSKVKLSLKYPPVTAGKTLCLLAENGTVIGLDAASGAPRWTYRQTGTVGPCAARDDVVVQSSAGLTLLDGSSGSVRKRASLGGLQPGEVAPVFDQGTVCLVRYGPPSDDPLVARKAYLHAFLVPSLSEQWGAETGIGNHLFRGDDLVVYLRSQSGTRGSSTVPELHDRQSGKLLSDSYQAPSRAAAASPGGCVLGGQVALSLTTGLDAYVASLKPGQENWHYQLPPNAAGAVAVTAPVGAQNLVIVGEEDQLYAFDAQTGKRGWTLSGLNGKVCANPLILGQRVFVASEGKRIYAKDL